MMLKMKGKMRLKMSGNILNKSNSAAIGALLALFTFGAVLTGLSSCTTLANVTSAAANIAGETGLINQNVAKSISASSEALGKAAEAITPDQEYYIGRAVAGNIIARYGSYSDATLEKYLNLICQTLVINSEVTSSFKGYHVGILKSSEMNAFATSGGHILVTRGLISRASSEDQIAAVLAHEISHIQLKHSITAIKSSRATNAILQTAGAAAVVYMDGDKQTTELVGALDDTVGDIISKMVDSGFSKNQEFAADKNALYLLSAAGYDPKAMESMLKMLKAGSASKKGFAKTHPKPEARMKKLAKLYSKYPVCKTQSARKERFAQNKR